MVPPLVMEWNGARVMVVVVVMVLVFSLRNNIGSDRDWKISRMLVMADSEVPRNPVQPSFHKTVLFGS